MKITTYPKPLKNLLVMAILPIFFMMAYVSAIFYKPSKNPTIGFVFQTQDLKNPLYNALGQAFTLKNISAEEEAYHLIKEKKLEAFINIHISPKATVLQEPIKLVLEGSNYSKNKIYPAIVRKIVSLVKQKMLSFQIQKGVPLTPKALMLEVQKKSVQTEFVYGDSNLSLWGSMSRIFIEFFGMMILVPIAFSVFNHGKEEFFSQFSQPSFTQKTRFVLTMLVSFGAIIFIQALVKNIFVFYIMPVGTSAGFLALLTVTFFNGFLVIAYGFLLSSFIHPRILSKVLMLFLVPQMIFSGTTDISKFYNWFTTLKYILPLPYNVNNVTNVTIRNYDFIHLAKDFLPWLVLLTAYLVLTILLIKSHEPSCDSKDSKN